MLNKWKKLWIRDKSISQWILLSIAKKETLKNQNVQRFLAIWGCCDRSFSCVHVFQTWFLVIRLEPTRRQFFSFFSWPIRSQQNENWPITGQEFDSFSTNQLSGGATAIFALFPLLVTSFLLYSKWTKLKLVSNNSPNQLQKENIFWSKNITLFTLFQLDCFWTLSWKIFRCVNALFNLQSHCSKIYHLMQVIYY